MWLKKFATDKFLLTPLREGRQGRVIAGRFGGNISTHAPAGGATCTSVSFAPSTVTSFLLTPLREGRRARRVQAARRRDISTHAPAGGATSTFVEVPRGCCLISTHAPAGGATHNDHGSGAEWKFLLTPLREGRRCIADIWYTGILRFLLTPLREGRPGVPIEPVSEKYISTHAPAGGATRNAFRAAQRQLISTHAPAGGATSRDLYSVLACAAISTHAPAGGATGTSASSESPQMLISTHAPAGGATGPDRCESIFERDFYSRPCGRGDK